MPLPRKHSPWWLELQVQDRPHIGSTQLTAEQLFEPCSAIAQRLCMHVEFFCGSSAITTVPDEGSQGVDVTRGALCPANTQCPVGGLAAPLAAVLNKLIENGSYAKILKKYNLPDNGVQKSEVNPDPGR